MTGACVVPLLLLVGCATATMLGETVTKARYDLPSYSIGAPTGDWRVDLDMTRESIIFGRAVYRSNGDPLQLTLLAVNRVPATESSAKPTEEAMVDEHLVRNLRELIKASGNVGSAARARNVEMGAKTVSGKSVRFLRCDLDLGATDRADMAGALLVYVHLPPDWKARGAFYEFVIEETWATGVTGASPDLTRLDPFVASFVEGPRRAAQPSSPFR